MPCGLPVGSRPVRARPRLRCDSSSSASSIPPSTTTRRSAPRCERSGAARDVEQDLVGFGTIICARIHAAGMEVSKTKTLCTASKANIGNSVARQLRRFGVKFRASVKSLDIGMAAGIKRNVKVARRRLGDCKRRISRFRRLKSAGVKPARILATGGTAGMTYNQACGVSPAMLRRQRRAVLLAASPHREGGRPNLDLGLIMLDGAESGRTDPAFQAHHGPIVAWANAVWNQWLSHHMMADTVRRVGAKLDKAKQPWQVVTGPAAAMMATARRLGWVVHDFSRITVHDGTEIDMLVDPPAAVGRKCDDAVRRWRWGNVAQVIPELSRAGDDPTPATAPIWKVCKRESPKEGWTKQHIGGLISTISGRQWPQDRCRTAGLASHNKCILCMHELGICNEDGEVQADKEHLIPNAPVGNLHHRHWQCPAHHELRRLWAPRGICDPPHSAAVNRPLIPKSTVRIPPPKEEATFH